MFIMEYILALDEEAQDAYWDELRDCTGFESCVFILPPPPQITPIRRNYVNPQKMASSVDGHLMFLSTMETSIGGSYDIVAVSKPVIDNTDTALGASIEVIDVYDAAWSPTAVDLAFASGGLIRHHHTEDDDVPLGQLTASETPGQLYLYQDYQQGHTEPQERLAYPQPNIDSNRVRALKWSNDGSSIAYARGETEEGDFFSSLWVTLVDNVRDESPGTIDTNTVLLTNLNDTPHYMSDFMWSPDGSGLLAMMHTDDGRRLRYISRDATTSFDSPILSGASNSLLTSLAATISPDGQFFAYVDEESTAGRSIPALYIQRTDGSSRIKVNVALQASETIQKRIHWSPHGDAVIYSINNISGSSYYLAKVNGLNQSLQVKVK